MSRTQSGPFPNKKGNAPVWENRQFLPSLNRSPQLILGWAEEGHPDLFRLVPDFPVFFRFVPICSDLRFDLVFGICSDLFRFAPFSSDLFGFAFRTNQNRDQGNPFLPTPFANPRLKPFKTTEAGSQRKDSEETVRNTKASLAAVLADQEKSAELRSATHRAGESGPRPTSGSTSGPTRWPTRWPTRAPTTAPTRVDFPVFSPSRTPTTKASTEVPTKVSPWKP